MAKILIIDDEVDMCWAISNVLEEEGHKIISAQDGPSGLRLLDEERPDLVLLDIRLPGMDGLEILKKVKLKYNELPVIMITGYGSVDSAVEVMKIGAFDYLSKPFDNNKMISTVQKAIGVRNFSTGGAYREQLGRKLRLNGLFRKGPEKGKIGKIAKGYFKGRVIAFSILLVVVLAGFIISKSVLKKTISYEIPYSHISAIIHDGKNIWTADWFSQNIYKHNPNDELSIAKTYHLPGIHPAGLTWDGEYFWTTDSWTKRIYMHDPGKNFSIIKTYSSPGTNPGAIMWDGKNIWSADANADKIYRHNMDAVLSVAASYNSPSTNPSGLVWNGKNICSCDADTNKIYKHSMDINLSVIDIYNPEEYSSAVSILSGFCWDGKNFWTCPEGANRIYKHSLNRMKIKKVLGW